MTRRSWIFGTGDSGPPSRISQRRFTESRKKDREGEDVRQQRRARRLAIAGVSVVGALAVAAWSPLGGITFYRDGSHGSTLQDPVVGQIAAAHKKSPAQTMLRWHLQQGRSVIPKSTKAPRIAENFDVFDFELSDDELAASDNLDTEVRGGPEPSAITLEAFHRDIPEA